MNERAYPDGLAGRRLQQLALIALAAAAIAAAVVLGARQPQREPADGVMTAGIRWDRGVPIG